MYILVMRKECFTLSIHNKKNTGQDNRMLHSLYTELIKIVQENRMFQSLYVHVLNHGNIDGNTILTHFV